MTGNLVPTPITDKNGVSTTRWKKSASASPSGQKLPPIPSMTPQRVDRVSLLGSLYKSFAEHGDHEEFDTDETCKCIKLSPDYTLEVIAEFIQKDGEIDDSRVTLAADIIYNYHLVPNRLNGILFYFDVFQDRWDTRFNEAAVIKLEQCSEIPSMEDYSLADEETQAEIRRLLKSAEEVYADDYQAWNPEYRMYLSERLREYIDSSSGVDRQRIDAIITERQTEDLDLIKSIMNNDAQAISSGIL